jgi:DNA-binding SARP family transcriptional activator/tetratricopeptide (TPR) repeat protein
LTRSNRQSNICVNVMRLLTFGGLWIESEEGSTTAQLRPWRLALLAAVAAAGERGISRERLAAVFWPDSDEERARHSLRQAHYALRVDAGREVFRNGGATLSLDTSVISADISDFHATLAAGDRAKAVSLATGPFLDGFYLPGCPSFERWVEDERSRIAASVTAALISLASAATRANDHDAATGWWRELTVRDPLNSRFALGYLKSLSARGDRVEALAFARRHESVVRRELETDPDPDVRALETELRAQRRTDPVRPAAAPPTRPATPLRLRTLGGLAICAEHRDEKLPVFGPRRLALLALVAAAGPPGVTREKIMGILWPESDEEQARHALSQSLYLLRRDSGRECIVGTAQLRLHDDLSADIRDFQEALTSDRLADAVAAYSGQFLDGFYLADAPQFEQWVEATRSKLQIAVIKALETLIRRAAESNPSGETVVWWQRLTEIDAYKPAYAAGLIRALIDAGDQTAARRFALEYDSRVRRELEAEPDPEIVELTASLRSVPGENAPSVANSSVAVAAVEPAGAVSSTRTSRRWWIPGGAIAAVLTAVLVWNIGALRASASEQRPLIAIGSIKSGDTTVSGPVLRDMLATNLARISGLRVVSNTRLLELLPLGIDTAPGATTGAARRAGAREIVEGEIAGSGGELVLTLRRVDLASGVVRQGYSVRAADAFALTDRATAAIAHDFHVDPPPDAVATVRTSSAVAYAFYEEGLRAVFRGDPAGAVRLMKAALDRDSTFAMAAYYGGIAAGAANAVGLYEEAQRLRALARRLAPRTIDRERRLIESTLAREEAPLIEFLPRAREFAAWYPDDPDAQINLGFSLAAAGDWAGSVVAFNRAIRIDSAAGPTGSSYCRLCQALGGLTISYLWWDSVAAAERTTHRLTDYRSEEGGWGLTLEPLLRLGRRAEAESLAVRLTRSSPIRPDFSGALDRDLIRAGRSEELEARLTSELGTAAVDAPGERPWLLLFSLRNQGRLREAEQLASIGKVPNSAVRVDFSDPVSQATVAYERGQYREAARRYLEIVAGDRRVVAAEGYKSRLVSWHMVLAGTALAAAGDTAGARALADSVERIGANSSFGRDLRLHHFLRGLLLQRQSRHAEAVEEFRLSLFSLTEGYTRGNLELARSLMALGRNAEAIAVLQPVLRGAVDGSATYMTHTELRELLAQAYEAAGIRDSAAVNYVIVERNWRRADPEFAARYARARAKVTQARSF